MGEKTGNPRGRPKGSPNRKTTETIAKVESSGLTPLDYMLSVLRGEGNDPATRLDAAKAAAPYVHARLSTVDVGNKDDKPFEQVMRWAKQASEATQDPSAKS